MNAQSDIVIIGAGGLGREVLALVAACNSSRKQWSVAGFIDADAKLTGTFISGVPVLGTDEWARRSADKVKFVCAIGNTKIRRDVVEKLSSADCGFVSLVHPDVRVPASVRIGEGTIVMAGTQFTTDARVGSHTVIYINCSITHDVEIGDYCMIAPGCNLAGAAIVEDGVQLGTGVNILPQRRAGAWATIGAGSVVVEDIPAGCTAAGVPCRVIRK